MILVEGIFLASLRKSERYSFYIMKVDVSNGPFSSKI